jgi:AcrR family transcriptional regulator
VKPTASRRVAKPAEERRKDLLDAAVSLFRDRGFDETTVQDIAEAAGVAAGTLYLYFPSKEHLLSAIHEEFERGQVDRLGQVIEELAEQSEGAVPDLRLVLDAMWDAAMAHIYEHREMLEVMCRYFPRMGIQEERRLDAVRESTLAELLRLGVEHGFVDTADPESTAYLMESINTSVGKAVAYGDPPDVDRLVAQAKEIYFRVLSPRPPNG